MTFLLPFWGSFLQRYTNNTTAMMTYCHTTLVVFIFIGADPAFTAPARPGAGHDMTYLAPPPHSSCLSSFPPFLLKLLVAYSLDDDFSPPCGRYPPQKMTSLCLFVDTDDARNLEITYTLSPVTL